MKQLAALLLILSLGHYETVKAQDPFSVLPYWKYYKGQPEALYRHLCEHAFDQLQARKKAIEALKTRQDWQNRQAVVRRKLQEAIGAFPEKTPLNPVVTGRIERNGIVVEKLYFESMPGYYVTAALFMPAGRQEKLPAIVFCSGHGAPAFRSERYQQTVLNYAKKGFAVLAFDPIGQGERIQYTKSEDKSFPGFKPTHEHSYPGAQSFAAGIPPALYFIWDGIRAIDYLLTRPDIDGTRIGVTGRSGGGTQSAYIAAMDPRVLAAAPECYLTSYDKLLRSAGPQDAEQILDGMLAKGLDMADLVEVRAPRPAMMVTTTRDMFSIEGARELFEEAKKAYSAFGAASNLDKVEDDAGHTSTPQNREATYAFFQRHLRNPGASSDENIEPFSAEDLRVTADGSVFTSLNSESLFSLTQKRAPAAGQTTTAQALGRQVISLTGYTPPKPGEIIFSGRFQYEGYHMERYLVKGPGAYFLPVLWFKPKDSTGRVLLYISSEGKSEAAQKGGSAEALVKAGYDVVLPDLSGAGELAHAYLPGGDSYIDSTSLNLWFAGILTGKSLVAVRMEEIRLLVDFIKKTAGVEKITAVGSGPFTSDLLHATLIVPDIQQIALLNGLVSYRSLLEHKWYRVPFIPSVVHGAIAAYDLPALIRAVVPRRVLLLNPVDAANRPVAQPQLEVLYKDIISAQSGSKSFKWDYALQDADSRLLEWLQQYL